MESNIAAVVSESPKAKEEAKNEEILTGSDGNIKNNKKAVVVTVVAIADHHGKVASITSSAKTESPQEIKKMMKNNKKKKNKVQVSNTKKPFIFYLNLAKRYINECNEVELCGLGMAIPTVITIAEILRRNGLAIQKGIMTSTVLSAQEDKKGRQIEKAKIEIVLAKAEKLDTTNPTVTPTKAADQSS
ncbi:uncharacterized protein At2g34160-like [Durio zibethinus]|uniref:Uncharacterized protein At2g34160-like n=1 Tax=Durio zibethinus TaxID=66656 RepID=A0A6P6A8J6_DURZI|nr:uncharacterized protein At2g34160-like [Durio zibethinus]